MCIKETKNLQVACTAVRGILRISVARLKKIYWLGIIKIVSQRLGADVA